MSKIVLLLGMSVSFFLGIALGFNADRLKWLGPKTPDRSSPTRPPGVPPQPADPPASARAEQPATVPSLPPPSPPPDQVSTLTGFRSPLGRGKSLTPCRDGDGFYLARDFCTSKLCGNQEDVYGLFHLGEDWNGEAGGNSDLGEPVYAIADGKVVMAERGAGCWGPVVVIEHAAPTGAPFRLADGTGAPMVRSLYAHFSEVQVAKGDPVKKGQRIGKIGKDCCECAAHLHFEIILNPSASLPGPGYYNEKYCDDALCGRIPPSEFIRLNPAPKSME